MRRERRGGPRSYSKSNWVTETCWRSLGCLQRSARSATRRSKIATRDEAARACWLPRRRLCCRLFFATSTVSGSSRCTVALGARAFAAAAGLDTATIVRVRSRLLSLGVLHGGPVLFLFSFRPCPFSSFSSEPPSLYFLFFSILGRPPRTGQPSRRFGRSRRSAGCADGRRCDAEAGA